MRNAASAFIMVVAAGLTLSAGTATNAGIISSLAPPTSRSTAAPAGTGRPATTQPTAATAIERRPPVSTVPTRFDAFDGLFALTLPPGWTMISRRDRANAYTGWTDASYDSSFSLYVWPSDAGLHPGTLLRRSRGAMELFFKDLRVLEESDLPLGPLECARLLAEGTDKDGVRLRLLALVAKNDQRTLELSFYVPVAKFDALRPTLEAMLKSFELTGTIVESANGKFTVMLPPDVKLVQDPKQPDRQHCRLGSDAELVFDVYHASAAYNAASLMERDRGNLVGKFPDYHVLQERKAPPSDLITGLVNGYMLLDEWTQPDGSRWRSGSFYYDDSNFIFTFHLYAKVATFMSLWPAAQRIAASYRDIDLVATGVPSGMRSVTASSGDFELLIPESWALDPATAEQVPHLFRNYRACDDAGIHSFAVRPEVQRVEQGLDVLSRVVGHSAQEIKIVKESDIKLGALPARERILELTRDGIRYRAAVQCAVQDGRVYQLWACTPAERYPFVRPTIDKVLASFNLLPPIDLTKAIPYENEEHHFRFSYPDALHPVGVFGGEVVRLAVRPAGPAVQYLENVVVDPPSSIKDPNLTLDKAAADWEKSQMRFLTGPKLKGWEDTTVGGIKAKRIIYDMTVKGVDGGPVLIRKMAYVIVRDGRSCSIRLQGRVPAFPVFFATAQKVIDTFEWTADK